MEWSLIEQSEKIRIAASARLDAKKQARLGQYFTPARAAELIASMPNLPDSGHVRILDPGAGSGMLTAAIVKRIVKDSPQLKISAVAVELDEAVYPALEMTADAIQKWSSKAGAKVDVETKNLDFVESWTGFQALEQESFDLVIMNPPYSKLGAKADERLALQAFGWECPNLYAAFMALGTEALKPGGQLIAITPRSFANGHYFTRFRRRLLTSLAINRLHTFESRSTVFADTGVLQENIILLGTKSGEENPVEVTVSKHHEDAARSHFVTYSDLVKPTDPNAFIRVSTNDEDTAVAERMLTLQATLGSLGVQVSTGKVVDFRQRENLFETPRDGCVPLVHPGNVSQGRIRWPRSIRKAQYFKPLKEADRKNLLPSGHYVLIKRFSTKEERRRIVAGLWEGSDPT